MLVAFKEELKRLAADPNDKFHSKVKARVGKKATRILETRLKQMILLTPSLLRRIQFHWQDESADARIKKLGGFVFAYLYNPKDFLSEDEHGLYGYLDDAYLVINIYERVLQGAANLSEEDRDFLEKISHSKKYMKALIPDETQKIEKMVESALNGEGFEKFSAAFQGAA
ncbi:hypothetical protein N9K06_01670 [Omnitrophica bacterium]|nr:hypothetical protein [Candidatus Omnitrophota bacterium]